VETRVSVEVPGSKIFDVFLCHNGENKPAVREIAQKLTEQKIKPWLDEADIRGGSFWHTTIGQQIETVKSAAVFVGQHGVGPWQNREIIALLNQFDRRGCPVIPVILPSAAFPGYSCSSSERSGISGAGLSASASFRPIRRPPAFSRSLPTIQEANSIVL
jgi:hypothetical protein